MLQRKVLHVVKQADGEILRGERNRKEFFPKSGVPFYARELFDRACQYGGEPALLYWDGA